MRLKRFVLRSLFVLLVWTVGCVAIELGYRSYLFAAPQFRDDPSAFDLYGVGESTMVGEPFDVNFSLPDLVSSALGGHVTVNGVPRPIQVRLLAVRGQSVYPQAIAFERAIAYRNRSIPGAVLIYAGHNEQIAPDGRDDPPDWAEEMEHSFPLRYSRVARDLFLTLRANNVIDTQHSMGRYDTYLRRIIEHAKRAGLTPVIYTLPSNDEIEPTSPDEPGLLDTIVKARLLDGQDKSEEAVQLYTRAIEQAPRGGIALLYYERGQSEVRLFKMADAIADFRRAVDQDPRYLFGRATTAQNELVRTIARDTQAGLADAARIIESVRAGSSVPFFSDGQHPNLEGYAWLANCGAQALKWSNPFRDGEDVRLRFHLTPEDLSRAHQDSGAWLITTAVHHPWPMDRMDLAETHYEQSLGVGDDFSGLAGMTLAQAGRNGMLRDEDAIALLGRLNFWYSPFLHVPDSEWDAFESELNKYGANTTTMGRLRSARAGSKAK